MLWEKMAAYFHFIFVTIHTTKFHPSCCRETKFNMKIRNYMVNLICQENMELYKKVLIKNNNTNFNYLLHIKIQSLKLCQI